MARLAILVCAMYALAALLWMGAQFMHSKPRWTRVYRASEYVGKSAAGFAMGLTVAVVLVFLLRLLGVFPPAMRP